MKTKFLTLDKPCDEKWENMTPNEKGSFCDSCSKNVIDFTKLSQFEISEIMKNSDGNICARLTKTQLHTPIFNLEDEKKDFRFPYSKVAAGLMLASSLTVVHPASAKTPKIQTETVQTIVSNSESEESHTESKPKISESNDFTVLKGIVVAESDNRPVENAKITFFTLNKRVSTYSKRDGTYSFKIPNKLIRNDNVISVSYGDVGHDLYSSYERKNYILNRDEIKTDFKVSAVILELYNGGIGSDFHRSDPIVIYNGSEIDYEEFMDAYRGVKNSCNLENKEYFYFEMEAAVAIYGEEAKHGLYILIEKPVK